MQMFSTAENPAQGISAVKALAIASAEGQRIWTIDQTNLNTALAAINLDADIENEIRSAVNAGKIATAHETPVAFGGSTVTGYLLIDPATGAGAYKISGGANGGYLTMFSFALGLIALIALGLGASAFFLVAVALTALAASIINFFLTSNPCGDTRDVVNMSLNLGFAGIGAILGLLGRAGETIVSAVASWVFGTGVNAALENSCR